MDFLCIFCHFIQYRCLKVGKMLIRIISAISETALHLAFAWNHFLYFCTSTGTLTDFLLIPFLMLIPKMKSPDISPIFFMKWHGNNFNYHHSQSRQL